MKNLELRAYARANFISLWRIADKLGCCAETVSRMLRKELSAEETAEIKAAIEACREEDDERDKR